MRIGFGIAASLVLCTGASACVTSFPAFILRSPYEDAVQEVLRAYGGRVYASGAGYLRQFDPTSYEYPLVTDPPRVVVWNPSNPISTWNGSLSTGQTGTDSSVTTIGSASWTVGGVTGGEEGSVDPVNWTGGTAPGSVATGTVTGSAIHSSVPEGVTAGTGTIVSGSWTGSGGAIGASGSENWSSSPGGVVTTVNAGTSSSLDRNTGTIAVPEPTAAIMAAPALAMLIRRRRSL